ncbi:hypothetical protein KUCAC02_026837 [Chaenocephalus aceratus]|nr:hypothetical protein KUCAC02_026837 [Chaenocephalus aceratus]
MSREVKSTMKAVKATMKTSVVVGPPAAGAFRERPPKSRTFRMFYERGDFPMALHRNAKGSQWKCPVRPEAGMSLRERKPALYRDVGVV